MYAVTSVLIETLWNVKELSGALKNVPGVGFNRNIVECKEAKAEDTIAQNKF